MDSPSSQNSLGEKMRGVVETYWIAVKKEKKKKKNENESSHLICSITTSCEVLPINHLMKSW